jgi:hypothetical protein
MLDMVQKDKIPEKILIEFYHTEFVESLRLLGLSQPAPTLKDLNSELDSYGKFIVLHEILFTGFGFLDPTTMNIVEDFFATNTERSINLRKKCYENQKCKAILQQKLKLWLERGWLEE